MPGVPGQGLLTMLAGAMLMDFPGKRSFLHKILTRPSLLPSINKLRARFSQPPVITSARGDSDQLSKGE